jgi:hypothetical protein
MAYMGGLTYYCEAPKDNKITSKVWGGDYNNEAAWEKPPQHRKQFLQCRPLAEGRKQNDVFQWGPSAC